MSLRQFDVNIPIVWRKGDYFSCQQHSLELENGVGKTIATDIIYSGRVLEVSSEGKITKATLEIQVKEGIYNQHTMPLKSVESIINMENGIFTVLETYEPIYESETPTQRYLFTITSGARNED